MRPNTTISHKPFCDCFECLSPDSLLAENHADPLLWVNNALGFGVKAGDVVETTKVVLLYGGKTATGATDVKAISPPRNFRVFSVDDKYLTFDNDPQFGQYKGYFINNDPNTYIVVPPIMKTTVETGQKVEQAVKDAGTGLLDFGGNILTYLKWGVGIVIAILVLVLIIQLTRK